jgi:hypothetical protein
MKTGEQEPRSAGKDAKNLIFWEFPRGSWQYDLVVALILLFIFVTPRDWFGDQPRAANIVLVSNDHGSQQLFLEADLLSGIPEANRPAKAAELIRRKTGKRVVVSSVKPIRDEADQEPRGFIAYTTPQN